MKTINIILGFIMIGFMVNSCRKDAANPAPAPSYSYSVWMTDAPGPYNAVFIDLQGIEITGSDGKTVLLNVNKGIYNLLNFSNGIDTLIASGVSEVATIHQIRFILGPNNAVVVNNNIVFPLILSSTDQSDLILQLNQTLQEGVQSTILIDFDANKSIVDDGNGNYKLKPVIRRIDATISGSIKGRISPVGIFAFVTATSTTTYCSNVTTTGDFFIAGLPPGNYSVTVTPALPLTPVTKSNIMVIAGITRYIGIIPL